MRFFVNLNTNGVTQDLFDTGSQADGWVSKVEGNDDVEVMFHRNGTPELLPANTPMLFGCKADGQYNSPNYLTSVAVFTTPADVTGFYTASLPTNTAPLNLALGSSDNGVTPGNLPKIETTDCEIDWWLNGTANPPAKSQTFSVEFDNTPCRGGEQELQSSTPNPPPQALQTAVAQAAAATAALADLGSGFALNPVATNAAKLALPTNTAAGYLVQITGEGNRIERYIGGGVGNDNNWLVLRNTVHLYLDGAFNFVGQLGDGTPGSITVNGVDVSNPNYSTIDCGWVDPLNIVCSSTSDAGGELGNGSYNYRAGWSLGLSFYAPAQFSFPQQYTNAGSISPPLLPGFPNGVIPIVVPARGTVTIVL